VSSADGAIARSSGMTKTVSCRVRLSGGIDARSEQHFFAVRRSWDAVLDSTAVETDGRTRLDAALGS